MALNTKNSIVDYLKSNNQDSSYSNRSTLAQTHGINNYQGTAQQNTALLNAMRNQVSQSTSQSSSQEGNTQLIEPVQSQQSQQSQQENSLIDNATNEANSALESYKEFLRGSSDSYYDNQQAMLERTKGNMMTNLEKALNEAVAQGKISQQQAEKQLRSELDAVNQNAYLNSQATLLSGESRGVGNSQQMMAMQQGDQRHAMGLRSDARTQRDERISTIRDRLSQINNNYNLDVANVENQYDTGLQQARAEADNIFNQGMSQMQLEQYKNALQMKNNLTLQEQQHLNQLEQMDKQYQLDLSKMKTAHGYDMEKIDQQFENDLTKMAQQHGYDMSKISAQHQNQIAQINAQKNAQMAQADAKRKQEEEALKNSYLDSNSWEYQVRNAQIEESHQNAYDQAYNKAVGEAKGILEAEKMYSQSSADSSSSSSSSSSSTNWNWSSGGTFNGSIMGGIPR